MADKDKKEKQDQAQGILETETLNRIFDTESISEDFSAQDEGSNVEAEQTNPQETGSANQPEGGETGLIPVESISKDSSAQNEGSNGAAEQPTSQETDKRNLS